MDFERRYQTLIELGLKDSSLPLRGLADLNSLLVLRRLLRYFCFSPLARFGGFKRTSVALAAVIACFSPLAGSLGFASFTTPNSNVGVVHQTIVG
jgi:hypothetical protein